MCVLSTLTKVEEREMPLPWVVYEGVYTPQTNGQFPSVAPAEIRMRFGAPARQELALKTQLSAQAAVPCHAPMTPDSCVPGAVVADVQPFDPARAAPAPHVTGCAAIDAASEQDRLNQSYAPSATVPERFQFSAGSATPGAGASATVNSIAKRLAADPTLECLAVVGQISSGEAVGLAEARARAIKALLEAAGVDKSRLVTIAVTARVYGPASNPLPADPEDRRVSLKVLLGSGAAPAPSPSPATGTAPGQ
jgi:outer membrane protein OmpA-like peptidoglycan-associated protein